MTDLIAAPTVGAIVSMNVSNRNRRRHRAEQRFRLYGIAAISFALAALLGLFHTVVSGAYSALEQTEIALNIHFDPSVIDPARTREPKILMTADYSVLVKRSLEELIPEARGRRDKRALRKIISSGAAYELRAQVLDDPSLIGTSITVWVPASADVDMVMKAEDPVEVGKNGRLNAKQLAWIEKLEGDGRIQRHFNRRFFTGGDSREPELAGILAAAAGSLMTLLICLLIAFPLGVMTAIYLEEFAPRNWWTTLIEVNINNLAAVPSIVFGLLGLAVLLSFLGMPRSAPLVGGIVLALMTLPTVIIAGRVALHAVPPSIREGAYAIGASPIQTVWHHVLPLAMPGVMTGTIIGMARALGETAPLLMIGMVAFIVDIPNGPTDPATVLPVQIFLWAAAPERAFAERTAAAVLVLLTFLVVMNLGAVLLRRKFETRW